jgi:hypothetical protein
MKDELLEKAKTDLKLLRKLKLLAVEANLYEYGCQLREIELAFFPETEEVKKANEQASKMDLLFRMMGVNCNGLKTCWILSEAILIHRKRKDKFDLMDAAKIKAKAVEYFD